MTNDGHDSSVTTAGSWATSFLTPLLQNPNFNQNTLVLLTFDEVETYSQRNNVFAVLLGDAVPANLVGTTDDSFYSHYSETSTVEANWGLHTLGRWDVGANVFAFVGARTGDKIRAWANPNKLNTSYRGILSTGTKAPIPVPNTNITINGRTVLPSIVSTWGTLQSQTYYTTSIQIPDGSHPPPA